MLKVNEEDYKLLYKERFIYFDNNKRYINLNKLIGLDNDNDLSDLIIDLYKHKRLDGIFNQNDLPILENNNDVVEIILDKEFVDYMKKEIDLQRKERSFLFLSTPTPSASIYLICLNKFNKSNKDTPPFNFIKPLEKAT